MINNAKTTFKQRTETNGIDHLIPMQITRLFPERVVEFKIGRNRIFYWAGFIKRADHGNAITIFCKKEGLKRLDRLKL